MKVYFLFALMFSFLTCGCSNFAQPQLINGQYYMGGDDKCIRYYQNKELSEKNRIICIDTNGDIAGYRTAMTPQEMQMWQYNQHLQAMQEAYAWQNFQNAATAFNQYSQNMYNTNMMNMHNQMNMMQIDRLNNQLNNINNSLRNMNSGGRMQWNNVGI